MKNYGQVLITSQWINLSDKDAEFYIQMRKHIFDDNITLEFKIKNNSENELEKLKIELEFE